MKKLSLNGFEVSSKATLSLICGCAAVIHLTFLLLFLKFKVMVLMYVNIASVALYVFLLVLSLVKKDLRHPIVMISIVVAEIILNSLLCTLLVGVDTCFILYPLITLPISLCYLFLYGKRSFFRRAVAVYVTVTFVLSIGAVIIAEINGGYIVNPYAVLSIKEKTAFRSVNILFAMLALYSFALMFYIEMTKLLEKLRLSTDKLEFTAKHDALTGLTNRRSFWDYFDELIGGDKHFNVAMGDLDNFKRINDTYGHGCGDLVLKSVADIINRNTGEGEIACRWGGEEMVVVFLGERQAAFKRLEEIRLSIQALKLTYEDLTVSVTMTFGFADSEETKRAIDECNIEKKDEHISKRYGVESLISLVDKRLYAGKSRGKNVVVDR